MIWVYFILVKWLYTFQPHPLNGGIDLSNPPDTVSLFFPGVVSDELGNRDMAISPNVDELFYTVQIRGVGLSAILHCKKLKHGTWSSPEVASFSGWASDLEPAFAPDGKRLFFSSNRSQKDKTKTDYDIWYVEKINDIWTSPRSLQAPINSDKNEFFPQITKSGNLYFTKEMEGKDEDIVVCKYINDLYQKPESLSDAINTTGS